MLLQKKEKNIFTSQIYFLEIITTAGSLRLILEELQALVVQVATGVSCEIKLLKLGRKRLRQSHFSQLIAAQVNTLRKQQKKSQFNLCVPHYSIYKTILRGSSFISECLKHLLNNCY